MIIFENDLDREFYFEFDNTGLHNLVHYLKNINNINSIIIINRNKEKELKFIIMETNTEKSMKKKKKLYVNDDSIVLQVTDDEIERIQLRLEKYKSLKNFDNTPLLNKIFKREWIFIYTRYITKDYLTSLKETLDIWNYKK